MNLYVKIGTGTTGKKYAAIVVDLGYRTATLTFDRNLCAELLRVPIHELFELADGNYSVGRKE